MITFWRRRRTLKGSLGRTGMETQTILERPSVYVLSLRNQSLTGSWPLDRRGYSEQGKKWDWSFGFRRRASLLEASHYGHPSWEVVGVHGQRFWLWTWPLEASHYDRVSQEVVEVHGQRFGRWASHYGRPSRVVVGVHGQRFGLWAWPLEASHYGHITLWEFMAKGLGFGLSPLKASHYGRPSREAGRVHGQKFGLWAWPLDASHYAQPKAPLPIFHWLCIFSPFLWTLNKVWPLNPTASLLGRL
jgi:hypothetical protein